MLVWRSAGIKAVPSHGRRQPGLSRKRGLPSESGSAVGANSHPWVTLTRWRCSLATTSSELACTMPPNGPDPRGLSSEPRVPGWRSSAGWAYKPLAAEPLCAFSGRSPNGSSHWVLRSFVGRLEPITGYRSRCGDGANLESPPPEGPDRRRRTFGFRAVEVGDQLYSVDVTLHSNSHRAQRYRTRRCVGK